MPATTSANIQQILAPEAIERQILVIRDPYIYEDLCDFQNIGAAPSARETLKQDGSPAEPAPDDEVGEIPSEELEYADVSATPEEFPARTALSDKAQGLTREALILDAISTQVDRCRGRIDRTVVETSTLAATVIGADDVPMTNQFYIGSLNAFRIMAGGAASNTAWVMAPSVFGALVLSLGDGAAAIFGSNTQVALGASSLMHQQRSGMMGRYLDCDIYTSPHVPASGAGFANLLVKNGRPRGGGRGRIGSVLKFVWKPPPVGVGADEIRVELGREGKNSRTDVIARTWFSVMVRNQKGLAQVVTA